MRAEAARAAAYLGIAVHTRQRTGWDSVFCRGRIVRANPKSAEMFKCVSPDAMIATQMQNLLRTADSGLSLIDVAKGRLAEEGVFNVESRMLRQDGEEFWSHLIAKSLDSNSQSGSEIWVINDVSEAKAKEKNPQRAEVGRREG